MPTRERRLGTACKLLLLAAVGLFLARPFLHLDADPALAALCTLFLALVQPLLSGSYRTPALILLGLGAGLSAVYRIPVAVGAAGLASMLNLVVLLVVMQSFTIPIAVGEYSRSTGDLLLSGVGRERTLFLAVSAITTLFSCFLNLGSVPVVLALLQDSIREAVPDYPKFASSALTRGYVCAVLWSPGGITVLMVAGITGLKWAQFFPFCLGLSLMGLGLSVLLQYSVLGRDRPLSGRGGCPAERMAQSRRKLGHIVCVVLAMMAGIWLCEARLAVSSTHCIVLAGLGVLSVWLLLLLRDPAKRRRAGPALRAYWDGGVPRGFDMGALFICMGFFTETFRASPLMDRLLGLAQRLAESGFWLVVLLPLAIILLAVVGIHPFISVTLAGNMLLLYAPAVGMLPVALALMFGSSAAYIVSPLAGVTLATAKFLNCPVRDVTLRWNGLYAAVFYAASVAAIWVVWRLA